jgi:ketosteroid isomerase-like protein
VEERTPLPTGPDDVAVLFQTAWDAFNRRDPAAIPDLVHDDVEFHAALGQLDAQTYRGHQGMRQWWVDMWTTFQEAEGTPEQIIAVRDHTLSICRFRARGLASSAELARPLFQVAQLRAGKIAWLFHSFDAPEALRVLAERLDR